MNTRLGLWIIAAMVSGLLACNDDKKVMETTIIQSDPPAPELVGAMSTGNTKVRVSYSVPMGDSAIEPGNYFIDATSKDSDVGGVTVMDAAFGASRDVVELTTMSQSSVTYSLSVVGVHCTEGRSVGPSTPALFRGTAPTHADITDADGDGLKDNEEMLGWTVRYVLADGPVVDRGVTSDPMMPDTDGDGLDDLEEQRRSTDPRDSDTDRDAIEDLAEVTTHFSDPCKQDSDGDTVPDGREINDFKTSPILADTDGDQIPDGEELIMELRDPRIADLPRPRVSIGNVDLQLDVRFDYTDTDGSATSESTTSSASLSQRDSQTFSTSDTDSTTSTIGVTNTLTAKLEISKEPGGSVENALELKAGLEQGHTSSFSKESTEASEQSYQDSLTTSSSRELSRAVTRSVVDAAMAVDLSVANAGDVAFTISDIELTAMAQNPRDRREMIAVATLGNDGLGSLNLGSLGGVSERGPIVFKSDQVFPQQVEELMKNPRGLIVELANFEIEDEAGRSFAFTSEEVYERTAGIMIDFGDGRIETYRVSTNSTYDANGEPLGVSMAYALGDILGLAEGASDGYETAMSEQIVNGQARQVEVLHRVRDRAAGKKDVDPTDQVDERRTFWVVYSLKGLDPAVDFNDISLRAGDEISLSFVQDQDADGLFAREEEMHGSSDWLPNTDGCPDDDPATPEFDGTCPRDTYDRLGDSLEVKDGWQVVIRGQRLQGRNVYSDPRQPDTDQDGLMDDEEFDCGLDPRQKDTDLDGLSDYDELFGGYDIRSANGQIISSPPRYTGQVILDGGNGIADTAVDPATDDVTVILPGVPTPKPGGIVVSGGEDQLIGTVPSGDDFIGAGHIVKPACIPEGLTVAEFATDPLNPDTDSDGVQDGAEVDLAIDPNNPADGARFFDEDQDGVSDSDEVEGFAAIVNSQEVTLYSDPLDADSDNDRLPDLLEHMLGSDPFRTDTDGDGLSDFDEYKDETGGDACVTEVIGVPCEQGSFLRPVDGYQDFLDECDAAPACEYSREMLVSYGSQQYGTNLSEADTDFDGMGDPVELEGFVIDGRHWATPGDQYTTVWPSPFFADADLDGWTDPIERYQGTDPNSGDTDGDLSDDSAEPAICTSDRDGRECRDPTEADRVVEFTYTSVVIRGDCDEFDPGDFNWSLRVDTDYASSFKARAPGGDDDNVGGGQVDSTLAPVTVELVGELDWNQVMRFGETFALAGFVQEIDEVTGSDAHVRWAPDGCPNCSFTGDGPDVIHDNTAFTISNALVSSPPVAWSGSGSCTFFDVGTYSWNVNAKMKVR